MPRCESGASGSGLGGRRGAQPVRFGSRLLRAGRALPARAALPPGCTAAPGSAQEICEQRGQSHRLSSMPARRSRAVHARRGRRAVGACSKLLGWARVPDTCQTHVAASARRGSKAWQRRQGPSSAQLTRPPERQGLGVSTRGLCAACSLSRAPGRSERQHSTDQYALFLMLTTARTCRVSECWSELLASNCEQN